MKKSVEAGREHLPCGMISQKMFQINHSKALIIAYLNMRGGLKKFTFCQTDISNRTNIGKTVARQYLQELVAEGVLNRRGKSFYKLNHQKMEELYYVAESEPDFKVSESDTHLSENDTDLSESDTKVSESDGIHSSKLDSSKLNTRSLESSGLDTVEKQAHKPSEIVQELLSKSPKEQVEWLGRVDARTEANRTMEKDLRAGKDVLMTPEFEDYFANQ